jgi:hypothetical protein
MPIFRGSDNDKKTFQRGDGGEVNRGAGDEPTTRRMNPANEPDAPPASSSENDPETQIIGGRTPKPSIPESDTSDPVVGWIVVIQGYGKGKSLQLGYGMNSIGRGQNARICLDFGDEAISRSAPHAIITYDPRGRKFYLQHGDGKNLTYLNNEPVLVPTQLTGGEQISLGQTILRFVPLCGEDFDWQDEAE